MSTVSKSSSKGNSPSDVFDVLSLFKDVGFWLVFGFVFFFC